MAQVTREVQTEEPVVVADEERDVVERRGVPGSIVAQRVVWYIVGIIVGLLALRFILQLLGANEGNAFVDLVYGVSGIFAAPFFGMFSYEPSYGVSYFEVSTVVAMIVYLLLGWVIARAFTLGSRSAAV